MTREQAVAIKDYIEDVGGKIDKEGYITGGCVYTRDIEYIIEREGLVFYCQTEKLMRISNWPEDMDKEPIVIKFKGFNDEDMELRITNDDGKSTDHDHLEVWHNGVYLGTMHICRIGVYVWPKSAPSTHVYFKQVERNDKET